jgi:hypothetical protein
MTTNLLAMPQVSLSVTTGNNEDWVDSIQYVVATGAVPPPQLDLRGIIFEMEIRRTVGAHEVVLSATTVNGTLAIGDPPNFGYLLFNIPLDQMKDLLADVYVGDMTGRDGNFTRVIAQIQLTVVQGLTVQPVVTTS